MQFNAVTKLLSNILTREILCQLTHLFISNIIWMNTGRFFHGNKAQYLQQMILHYISDDAKLVKIATTALSTKWFLENYLNRRYVKSVPRWAKYGISKPKKTKNTQNDMFRK